MRQLFALLALALIMITFPLSLAHGQERYPYLQATIIEQPSRDIMIVRINEGKLKGKTYEVNTFADHVNGGGAKFKIGDEILVSYDKPADAKEMVNIVDHVRFWPVVALFALFVLVTAAVARWRGLLAIAGMFFSFAVIIYVILPQIIAGVDPILISLVAALIITPVTYLISHGLHLKTYVAMAGTGIALVLTGILAVVVTHFANLTGLAGDESVFVMQMFGQAIDMRNLLIAGMIVTAMGVLDDVTVSQASIVESFSRAHPKATFFGLYNEAMKIGVDHIASLVNTLIIVYAGASLPLFLLFYNTNTNISSILSFEIITTEIAKTLVSSIGIILAVPITTLIAVWAVRRK